MTELPPDKLGASSCPNCGQEGRLQADAKSVVARTVFVEIRCTRCLREAASDVHGSIMAAIKQAVSRWNSSWPDVAYFLDSDTEGIRG